MRVEMRAPAHVRRARPRTRLCGSGGRDGGGHVGGGGLADAGDLIAGRRVADVEEIVRLPEAAVDEEAEAVLALAEPGAHGVGGFGRGAVRHGFEDVGDFAHSIVSQG